MLHLDDGEQVLLQIPQRVHALYEAYCDIRLAPVAAPPVDDDESAGGAQQQPAAAGGEQQRAAAGALHAPVPQAEIDPLEATTPLVQKQFFEQILLDVAHGNSPPYAEWEQLEVVPPNPLLCGTCEDADGYSDGYAVKPIRFWSHEMWGIETPCANHGWAHSQFVTLGQWHMRRVKDVFDDFYLAGRRTSCSKCKAEKESLKEKATAVETALGDSADPVLSLQLQILQAEVKACKYSSSTLNPVVNKHVFERYPGIGVAFPAIVTHKAAISIEAMMVISRAARTSQSSHDLEAMFNEFRTLKAARNRLGCYQVQRMAGVLPADITHYEVGISTISDTYITEALNTFHETHLRRAHQYLFSHVQPQR